MVVVHEIESSSGNTGAVMNEVMTLAEMEERFKSEWILIGEPETDEHLHVLCGRVLFHSPDRDAMYQRAIEMRPGRFATHYTGTIPEGTAVVL